MAPDDVELTRAVILQDGSAIALFNSAKTIYVHPSGACFAAVIPGQPGLVKHRVEHCVSAHIREVSKTIIFRNEHLTPFLCKHIVRPEAMKTSPCPIADFIRWPVIATKEHLSENDGSREVRCMDGVATARLLPSRRHIAVMFPSRMPEESWQKSLMETGVPFAKYEYADISQIYPLDALPEEWLHVARLLQVDMAHIPEEYNSPEYGCHVQRLQTGRIPTLAETAAWDPGLLSSFDLSAPDGWPRGAPCVVDYRDGMRTWFALKDGVPRVSSLLSDGSSVTVSSDGSLLECLFKERAFTERIFSVAAAPPKVDRYEVGKIARILQAMHDQGLRSVSHRDFNGPSTEELSKYKPRLSNGVVESLVMQGEGQFTAYIDGRIRVRYDDRTIVEIDQERHYCDILSMDGRAIRMRCAKAIGVEIKVARALQFGRWAFMSPHERAEEEARKSFVAKAIEAEKEKMRRHLIVNGALNPRSKNNGSLVAAPEMEQNRPARVDTLMIVSKAQTRNESFLQGVKSHLRQSSI